MDSCGAVRVAIHKLVKERCRVIGCDTVLDLNLGAKKLVELAKAASQRGRRSPSLGLLTLTVMKESFGASTGAGLNGGNAKFSRLWISARRVRHSYDCFLAARTHRPDPLQSLAECWTGR